MLSADAGLVVTIAFEENTFNVNYFGNGDRYVDGANGSK